MRHFKTLFLRLVLPTIIAVGLWVLAISNFELSNTLAIFFIIEGTLLIAFTISFSAGFDRGEGTPNVSYPNFFLGLTSLVVGLLMTAVFPGKVVTSNGGFVMKDNLMCTIEQSYDRRELGHKIALIDLQTTSPRVLYSGTGETSSMAKLWESDKTLTIQVVATATGSVETIVVEKKTGRFSRAAAGSLADVYSYAQLGSCR
jgi:hypothetical protein